MHARAHLPIKGGGQIQDTNRNMKERLDFLETYKSRPQTNPGNTRKCEGQDRQMKRLNLLGTDKSRPWTNKGNIRKHEIQDGQTDTQTHRPNPCSFISIDLEESFVAYAHTNDDKNQNKDNWWLLGWQSDWQIYRKDFGLVERCSPPNLQGCNFRTLGILKTQSSVSSDSSCIFLRILKPEH